jgi:hypothetical protein
MGDIKLPLWSAGVVVSILSPIVEGIASRGNIDWHYLGWFNLILWAFIGVIYFFDAIFS